MTRDIDAPDWRQYAACTGSVDALHPIGGPASHLAARQWCARCPVTAECLDYALAHDERFGVWGGMTPGERKAEAKRRKAVA